MSLNINDNSLSQQLDKMHLKTESKYDEEIMDEAITNGLKGEHKAFCLKIEAFLNQFMKGQKDSEVIPDLDKYQRKIVHKICDLYGIKREYVDIKNDELGSITIVKTESSFIPSTTLEARYQKYLEKSKKQAPSQSTNPFANKKVLIKTRLAQPESKTRSDKSESSDVSLTTNSQSDKMEVREDVEDKKKKEYELAREKILQENELKDREVSASNPTPNTTNPTKVKSKKKGRFDGYDPDYDRYKGQSNASNMPNLGGPMPMNPMPGMPVMMGMPPMHNPNGMGYYPMYNAPFVQYQQGFPAPNSNMYPQPNFRPFNNYGPPPPTGIIQFPSGGIQHPSGGAQQQSNTGASQNGPVQGGYFQNFPSLDSNGNPKK